MSRAIPGSRNNSPQWDKYRLGFIWEEIHLASMGQRLKILERVYFGESERVMQNIVPGNRANSANLRFYVKFSFPLY